jgi:KaiC/GvpD/RAD55 family RecA-like ATPase
MKTKVQLVLSGIPLVDKFWGGFYRGGTYFLIGRHKSGKTLLGIQYAIECIKRKEVCLYFTTMRPKDLMIHAASIDFDLQQSMDQNFIIVVRVTPPSKDQSEKSDEYLLEYLTDIASLVKQYNPSKIVFDELTPFVEFKNLNLLRTAFMQTMETIQELNSTSLFVIGEPAAAQSKSIVDILTSESTGAVYLEKEEDAPKLKSGTITIIPNVGHIEGKFSSSYYLEPYKGITTEPKSIENEKKTSRPVEETNYKSISELELPEAAFPGYGFYSPDEFSLFINNLIGVYKSTGQKFSAISFRLNPEIESLININQLKNAVRLSINKKDKISVINDKVIVLSTQEEENLNSIARVKNNLFLKETEELNKLLEYISVYIITIDDTFENADDFLRKLLIEEAWKNNRVHVT